MARDTEEIIKGLSEKLRRLEQSYERKPYEPGTEFEETLTQQWASYFEIGNFNEWSWTGGSPTVVTDIVFQGLKAMCVNDDSWYAHLAQKSWVISSGTYALDGYLYYVSYNIEEEQDIYTDILFCFQSDIDSFPYSGAERVASLILLKTSEVDNKFTLFVRTNWSTTYFLTTDITPETGQWYHIRIEVILDEDSGTIKLYIDSILKATKTGIPVGPYAGIMVGSDTSAYGEDYADRNLRFDYIRLLKWE